MLSTPPGRTTERWPPLGLLYIASSLRQERHDEIMVLDAFCRNMDAKDIVREAEAFRPDIIGMNCSTHTFLEAMAAMWALHQALPDAKLILGGYHATFTAPQILTAYPFIDFILKGEAEHALVQLLDRLEDGADPEDVEGLTCSNGGKFIDNPLTLIEDLDSLPAPDRRMLGDFEYGYEIQGIRLTFSRFTTVSTSRGCSFHCRYCSCAAFSLRQWRPRSAESVVDELQSLYREGYRDVVLVDDNFTHDPKRAERICDLLLERDVHLHLYCEGRVDSAKPGLLRRMKSAGFDVIYFGAESASQRTLDYYQKRITPERTGAAIRNAKEAGLIVIISFIFGAPSEGAEDVNDSIEFARRNRPHGVQFNILDCLVGTDIWEEMRKKGFVGEGDWVTNHRIYEYYMDGPGKDRLQALVDQAYATWLDGWKNISGIIELLRLLVNNGTARKVVLHNIMNPAVSRGIKNGLSMYGG